MADAVFSFNSSTYFIDWTSDTFSDLLGYGSDEIVGQPISRLWPADKADTYAPLLTNFVKTDITDRYLFAADQETLSGQHKEGHEIPVDAWLARVPNDGEIAVLLNEIPKGRHREPSLALETELRFWSLEHSVNSGHQAHSTHISDLTATSPDLAYLPVASIDVIPNAESYAIWGKGAWILPMFADTSLVMVTLSLTHMVHIGTVDIHVQIQDQSANSRTAISKVIDPWANHKIFQARLPNPVKCKRGELLSIVAQSSADLSPKELCIDVFIAIQHSKE
ncbi:MAG: PAS domain-containing protein [Gammaproteobacteria bacterium]